MHAKETKSRTYMQWSAEPAEASMERKDQQQATRSWTTRDSCAGVVERKSGATGKRKQADSVGGADDRKEVVALPLNNPFGPKL